MLIGALLVLVWVMLLVRYPQRAVPVSLLALLGLGLVAAWTAWDEHRLRQSLGRLNLDMNYRPERCPAGQPLLVQLRNDAGRPLSELHWQIAAYAEGGDTNLVQPGYDRPRYHDEGPLASGETWQACIALPPLRPGYRPNTLAFRADRLEGRFDD